MPRKNIVKRDAAKVSNYTVTHEGESYDYTMQAPTFEQLSAALTESVGLTGKLNMSGGGKVIWELCVSEFDEGITDNPQLLLTVCIDLYHNHVLPADAEIKKN